MALPMDATLTVFLTSCLAHHLTLTLIPRLTPRVGHITHLKMHAADVMSSPFKPVCSPLCLCLCAQFPFYCCLWSLLYYFFSNTEISVKSVSHHRPCSLTPNRFITLRILFLTRAAVWRPLHAGSASATPPWHHRHPEHTSCLQANTYSWPGRRNHWRSCYFVASQLFADHPRHRYCKALRSPDYVCTLPSLSRIGEIKKQLDKHLLSFVRENGKDLQTCRQTRGQPIEVIACAGVMAGEPDTTGLGIGFCLRLYIFSLIGF